MTNCTTCNKEECDCVKVQKDWVDAVVRHVTLKLIEGLPREKEMALGALFVLDMLKLLPPAVKALVDSIIDTGEAINEAKKNEQPH